MCPGQAFLQLPYETARVRLALAQSLAGQPEVAVAEAQGAFATFERLGAVADADEAARLIRRSGAPPAPDRRMSGCSANGSRRCCASNILSKLGLRNRSEAAIQAGRLLPTAEAAP